MLKRGRRPSSFDQDDSQQKVGNIKPLTLAQLQQTSPPSQSRVLRAARGIDAGRPALPRPAGNWSAEVVQYSRDSRSRRWRVTRLVGLEQSISARLSRRHAA